MPRPSLPPVFDHLQSCFSILQAIKNWRERRPGHEATKCSMPKLCPSIVYVVVSAGENGDMVEEYFSTAYDHRYMIAMLYCNIPVSTAVLRHG